MGSYRILLILFAFILACGGEDTPRDSRNTSDNEGTSPSSDTGTDSDSNTEEGDGTGEEGTGDNQDQNADNETDEDKEDDTDKDDEEDDDEEEDDNEDGEDDEDSEASQDDDEDDEEEEENQNEDNVDDEDDSDKKDTENEKDTGVEDTGEEDTGEEDTGDADTSHEDTEAEDTGQEDTAAVATDTGSLEPVVLDLCVKTCSEPGDCVAVGADEIHDDDNYSCTNNHCVYNGCNGDAECNEAFPGLGYLCRNGECVMSCTVPKDCEFPISYIEDEDNWLCDDGACIYLGCIDDRECKADRGSEFTCQDIMGNGLKTCQVTCREGFPEDCVINADDESRSADNFVCVGGDCIYIGCNSDEECGAGYQCTTVE